MSTYTPSAGDSSRELRRWAIQTIVCFGIVSLFADMTYEGARSIGGPFLQSLGASAAAVGFIAGFGEMLAAGLRYFWGKLIDRTRAYWAFTFLGYVVTLLSVPLLAFAGSWQLAGLLIVAERTGKSIRGPARDVLMSQATDKVGHGWGFGLHAAMDQTGALIGPLLVAASVAASGQFRGAFLRLGIPVACGLPALIAAWVVFQRRGSNHPAPPEQTQRELPPQFRPYVIAAALLAFGFADFALISFHIQKTGLLSSASIPLLYSLAMGMNGLGALLFGKLFDRFGLSALSAGIVVSAAGLPLAFFGGPAAIVAAIILWGAGIGAQDACLRAGLARVVSMNKRGAAFGAFSGVFGVAWFLGSAAMGVLYGASLVALVALGVAAQCASATLFFRLRKQF
jgi:MFS family permease